MEKKENKKMEQAKDNSKELAMHLTRAIFKFMSKNPDATAGEAMIGLSLFTATFLTKVDTAHQSNGRDVFDDYLELLKSHFQLGRQLAKAGLILD